MLLFIIISRLLWLVEIFIKKGRNMKRFDLKSIIVGLVIGIIGSSIIFTAGEIKPTGINNNTKVAVAASAEGIKSATLNSDKVYFNGNLVDLKNPLVTIIKDGSSKPQLYMPMTELLEYMHFKVEWNSKNHAVYLTMKGQENPKNINVTSDISKNKADAQAIEIIQKTGNWSYIEKYLPYMSPDGINKVVDIYNSKHINISEHKKASDYIKN